MERSRTRKTARQIATLLLVSISIFLTVTVPSDRVLAGDEPSKSKIFAQVLVEDTLAKHTGLSGLGLATIPPNGHDCVTIADTDAKELGDKCDKGELAVMKTGKSSVEKEGDGYDVTLPFHVSGKTIGIIAMDFKLDQQESGLLNQARAIAKELEGQIPSKSKLFEPTK